MLIGNSVNLWVVIHRKPVLKQVIVENVYPNYILFNTGRYKFCGLKTDLQKNNKKNPIWIF